MTTYILIPVNSADGEIIHGFNCYPTDSAEQIEAAIEALRDAGVAEAPVWTTPGDEDSPDAYRNGQNLLGGPGQATAALGWS